MTFGSRLKSAREEKELTQAELGRGLGTDGKDASKSVVMGWEKDKHHPRADQLAMICERLKCSADYLLFGAVAESALSEDARRIAAQFDSVADVAHRRVLLMTWEGVMSLARNDIETQAPRRRVSSNRL